MADLNTAFEAPRRRTGRRLVAAGTAVVVLLGGGVAALASTRTSSSGQYRTATVTHRSVDQELDGVATVEPVSQAAMAFPVAGTVKSVAVAPGNPVVVGELLADLDTGALDDALDEAEAANDQAELTLQRALAGENVGVPGGSAGSLSGARSAAGASVVPASFTSGDLRFDVTDATSTSSGATTGRGGSSSRGSSTAANNSGNVGSTDAESSTAGGTGGSTAGAETGGDTASAGSGTNAAPDASGASGRPGATGLESAGSGNTTAAAQQAVLEAQKQVDADLAAAGTALDSSTRICAKVAGTTAENDGGAASPSGDSRPARGASGEAAHPDAGVTAPTSNTITPSSTTTPAVGASDDAPTRVEPADVTACQAALKSVLDAQHLVATDQARLAAAASSLDRLLTEQAGSGSATTSQAAPGSRNTGRSGTGISATTGSVPSATSNSSSPSSEDLIAYQKAVDAEAAQVAVAEQSIAQARLLSPIAGTVATVGIAAGDSVTAGSSTAKIVVVAPGGYEVTTSISVADLPHVKVGQPATISPDGQRTEVKGEVVAIGRIGSSNATSTSYPVTIGVTGDGSDLGNGATASVAIITDRSVDALAVPTSAVHVESRRKTVTVVEGDATRQVGVETGAVGSVWTQVKTGLRPGQQVVIADLDSPLPSSATDTSNPTTGNRFGFPGAGGTGGFGGARNGTRRNGN